MSCWPCGRTRERDDSPEYSLGLQALGLLQEVDGGHHDGGDSALLVVDDPLQGDSELLAGHPARHGEVARGDGLGQPAHISGLDTTKERSQRVQLTPILPLIVFPDSGWYWQGVDVHMLLQL